MPIEWSSFERRCDFEQKLVELGELIGGGGETIELLECARELYECNTWNQPYRVYLQHAPDMPRTWVDCESLDSAIRLVVSLLESSSEPDIVSIMIESRMDGPIVPANLAEFPKLTVKRLYKLIDKWLVCEHRRTQELLRELRRSKCMSNRVTRGLTGGR